MEEVKNVEEMIEIELSDMKLKTLTDLKRIAQKRECTEDYIIQRCIDLAICHIDNVGFYLRKEVVHIKVKYCTDPVDVEIKMKDYLKLSKISENIRKNVVDVINDIIENYYMIIFRR